MKSFSRPFISELEDILPRVMANRTSLSRSEIKEEIDFIRSEIGYEEFYEDIRKNDGGRYMRISRIGQMFPLQRPERQEVIRAFSRAFEVVFENFEVRSAEGRSSDTIYESAQRLHEMKSYEDLSRVEQDDLKNFRNILGNYDLRFDEVMGDYGTDGVVVSYSFPRKEIRVTQSQFMDLARLRTLQEVEFGPGYVDVFLEV